MGLTGPVPVPVMLRPIPDLPSLDLPSLEFAKSGKLPIRFQKVRRK